MTFAIGVRVYQITLSGADSVGAMDLTNDKSASDLLHCGRQFIAANTKAVMRQDLQRVWFLREKSKEARSVSGIIRYGTYGFESRLVDSKTRTYNYTRKVSDVEEIPLYFSFWVPSGKNYGLICFQSFQTRSCATMILNALRDFYENKHKGCGLRVKKIMPSDVRGSAIYSAPVKSFTYVKQRLSKDVADGYLKNLKPDEVKFEVKIVARRKGFLGTLGEFSPTSKSGGKSLLLHDGIQFDEAKAEIMVGNRKRTVGVIGHNSDIGTIDVSEAVKMGADGHPSYVSIKREADSILRDFYQTLAT